MKQPDEVVSEIKMKTENRQVRERYDGIAELVDALRNIPYNQFRVQRKSDEDFRTNYVSFGFGKYRVSIRKNSAGWHRISNSDQIEISDYEVVIKDDCKKEVFDRSYRGEESLGSKLFDLAVSKQVEKMDAQVRETEARQERLRARKERKLFTKMIGGKK